MRLFKNAVGRESSQSSLSITEGKLRSERHVGGREGGKERRGREGRREEIFVCEATLAACCSSLASSFHLSGSGVGVEDTHCEY